MPYFTPTFLTEALTCMICDAEKIYHTMILSSISKALILAICKECKADYKFIRQTPVEAIKEYEDHLRFWEKK